MKLVFFASQCLPFDAETLSARPLGGTETAVIHLSEALHRRGHDVTVITPHAQPASAGATYLTFGQALTLTSCDVLVAVRAWQPLFCALAASLRLFWTGDSYDALPSFGIGDRRVQERIDAVLAVSDWQARLLAARSGFPLKKTWVLRNGVRLEDFAGAEGRIRKRLIYTSTPQRGLAEVPRLYLRLKTLHADAQLQIYSGYDVYDAGRGYDPARESQWRTLRSQLEQLPDCTVNQNVPQPRLAREFMRSAVLFYPNTFDETSCITAMEAQAAGCAIVSSRRAALPETVGEAGILVEGVPGTALYDDQFVSAVDQLLRDDARFRSCSSEGLRRAAAELGWTAVAERFETYVRSRLNASPDPEVSSDLGSQAEANFEA